MEVEKLPVFWQSGLEQVESCAQKTKKAEMEVLTFSAGQRPVWKFAYGEKEALHPPANYNSACGAHDRLGYLDRTDKKPVVLLVGAIHGQETEGTVALLNLISLLETGKDLANCENPALVQAAQQVRLIIIPVMNPDGRARVVPSCMLGLRQEELEYWGQGTWKDGSLCKWPDCKKIHPVLNSVEFLGGYYNDDGINLMHDQFFHPMAKETQALLDLMEQEYVDCALLLHGGTNSVNDLIQPDYVCHEASEAVHRLAFACDKKARTEGEFFLVRDVPMQKENGNPPPAFNLTSALHHVAGAVTATFECNECIVNAPGPKQTHEQVLRGHMILFEETFRMFLREQGRGGLK